MAKSKQELESAVNRLVKDEVPSEDDYRMLIGASSDDVEVQKYRAQNLHKFIGKFPSLASDALDAQMALASDADSTVKAFGVRNLFDFVAISPERIVMFLVPLTHDADGTVTTMAKTNFRQHLPNSNKVFLNSFISVMKADGRTTEEKNAMIKIIMDYFDFTATTKDALLSTVDVSLTADTVLAVKLVRKYGQFLNDKERDERLNTFFNNLFLKLNDDEEFEGAIQHIIVPSIASVPFREGTAGQRLFTMIAESVFPKLNRLTEKWQAIVLRVIADAIRFANETGTKELIDSLYDNLFTKIGSEFKNVLVVEPILFMVNTLVKKAPEQTTEVFGILFVMNGTEIEIDEKKKAQIQFICPQILSDAKDQIEQTKSEAESAPEEEKRKKMKYADEVQKAGNNCIDFSKAYSSEKPFEARKPKNPSWGHAKEAKPAKPQQQQQQQQSRNYRDRENSYRDRESSYRRPFRGSDYNHSSRGRGMPRGRGSYGNRSSRDSYDRE